MYTFLKIQACVEDELGWRVLLHAALSYIWINTVSSYIKIKTYQ